MEAKKIHNSLNYDKGHTSINACDKDCELGIPSYGKNKLSRLNSLDPIFTTIKRSLSKEFGNSPFANTKKRRTPPNWQDSARANAIISKTTNKIEI